MPDTETELENAEELLADSGAYEVKLENFEGPLDLLLPFIRKANMAIEYFFVS